MPPRKGENANYLSIKHVYLRVARGDLLERLGVAIPKLRGRSAVLCKPVHVVICNMQGFY